MHYYNCSISLLVIVDIFLVCLSYKLNFIVCIYVLEINIVRRLVITYVVLEHRPHG